MTANQINYAKQMEEARHNLRTEGQKDKDLTIAERNAQTNWFVAQTGRASQEEGARHNLEQERINWFSAKELGRHNLTSEAQTATQLTESERHNRMAEGIQRDSILESRRHNVAQENLQGQVNRETMRHNKVSEGTEKQRARAAITSAGAAQQQAYNAAQANTIRQGELAETIRRNIASQDEINRHNLILEQQEDEANRYKSRTSAAQALNARTSAERQRLAEREFKLKKLNSANDYVTGLAKTIIGRGGLLK